MRNFVVVGMPRTGSTLLLTGLAQHPQITAFGELFHAVATERTIKHAFMRGRRKVFFDASQDDAIEFLKSKVFPAAKRGSKAVGFKLFAEHVQCRGTEKLFARLKTELPDLRLIHIVRPNYLEVMVSRQVAIATKSWEQPAGQTRSDAPQRVRIDPDQATPFFARMKEADRFFETFFGGENYLRVEYGVLARDFADEMNRVYAFLDVCEFEPKQQIEKQILHPLSEVIENYGELREALSNTEHRKFFTHQSVLPVFPSNTEVNVSPPKPGKARFVTPMRKRVYLHIGLHKTGTTSIQWALTFSRAEARDAGFLYPTTGVPECARFGQHLLAWSLVEREAYLPYSNGDRLGFDDEMRAELWDSLRNEIAAAGTANIIISSEEFDILTGSEIRALGEHLSEFDLTPVMFLRNYADWLESCYRTAILHSSYIRGFDEFVANQRSRLDFAAMIQDWRSIASAGRVEILSYDDEAIRRDSVSAFLDAVNFAPEGLSEKNRVKRNESLPAFVCEIARFLCLKGCGKAQFQEWIANMRQVPFSANAHRNYTFLTDDLRRDLDRRYESEVAKIEADPVLRCMVQGSLALRPAGGPSQRINNILLATLAMGRELSRAEMHDRELKGSESVPPRQSTLDPTTAEPGAIE